MIIQSRKPQRKREPLKGLSFLSNLAKIHSTVRVRGDENPRFF